MVKKIIASVSIALSVVATVSVVALVKLRKDLSTLDFSDDDFRLYEVKK